MANLTTKYLGIELKNPLIVGSCGLTATPDSIARLAKNGAAAVVLKSIFEEEIQLEYQNTFKNQLGHQENNLEFFDYYDYQLKNDMLERTTQLIKSVKEESDIKVIASINCRSVGEWFSYAAKLQDAGADAIELNVFRLPVSIDEDAATISARYINIIKKVKSHVSIPVSIKLSPFFTDTAHMAKKLEDAGVEGLVLFNRYYNPDIDLVNNKIVSGSVYSAPSDYVWSLRWISILSDKLNCDLVGSTGIHTPDTMLKMLISGAKAVQVVSAIYKNGPDYIMDFLHGLEKWMDQNKIETIDDLHIYGRKMMPNNPEMFERVQFMKYFGEH
ncbi:dihydroorotate dehydrogenase-like protein [Natronoflexus pectinivorans]|uniref:dihydrouracil dehydrogenase (NAD(+)) n=1 Tax=Natronoflexus pectinivorans TaxID=682526 RepID=A0A4R2GDV2_9BACT|nr:dihydroorotate dehydrogenase-like protein [Natronoflexus pectinivorans]TCO06090.1 dihydroorotate dehydrogenase (fumarate) [Natronoflexus pectinivorans]